MQLDPGARLPAVQVVDCRMKSSEETSGLAGNVTAESPVLVRVRVRAVLVVFKVWLPKLIVGGVILSWLPIAPVPVRVTLCCGANSSLSVMVRVPLKKPAVGGVNVTEIVQVACGAREPVHVFAETAKFELADTPEIVRLLLPSLTKVVVNPGQATAIAQLPKLSAVSRNSPSAKDNPLP